MGNPATAVVASSGSSNRGQHAHSPTSAPFDHAVDAHVVAAVGGSPRRHHLFVAFNSFNDGDAGEASRNSDEPPPCASASGQKPKANASW